MTGFRSNLFWILTIAVFVYSLRNNVYQNKAVESKTLTLEHNNAFQTVKTVNSLTVDKENRYSTKIVSPALKIKSIIGRLVNASTPKYPITLDTAYLIENPHLCATVNNLSVLIVVHSAPYHFTRRQTIRKTWANDSYYFHLGSARILFLLGRVQNQSMQLAIEQEFMKNGDILQGDFIDDYRNLSHKGVMGFKWISERCRNAKIVLKVDDDVVVNMFEYFISYMPKYIKKSKNILCIYAKRRIIRERYSKWFIESELFKNETTYPNYCYGFIVIITNDLLPALYHSAKVTPLFWVDDVYLYGLVPGNIPGINYEQLKRSSFQVNDERSLTCFKNRTKYCNLLVSGARTNEIMDEIWRYIAMQYKTKTTPVRLY